MHEKVAIGGRVCEIDSGYGSLKRPVSQRNGHGLHSVTAAQFGHSVLLTTESAAIVVVVNC